ncbi:hypothetical protein XELAEV_18015546mg [Xenopus laevis]|uniref:GIY-YIG domain-containing protein n=1 Tax=Xenopus laevis TaxID=8355 RepID=A0A974DJV4_XENLA|nr:hypothetical protein XELAEV_18015546mg [Xenopus laevis]
MPPLLKGAKCYTAANKGVVKEVNPPQKGTQRFLGKPKVGTYACLSCNCCSSIIKGDAMRHPTQGTPVKLKHYATCDTSSVVYLLKCPSGLVYIGQTKRPIKTRIKEHMGNIRNFKKGTATDTTVSRHFNSAYHNQSQLRTSDTVRVQAQAMDFCTKFLVSEILKCDTLTP